MENFKFPYPKRQGTKWYNHNYYYRIYFPWSEVFMNISRVIRTSQVLFHFCTILMMSSIQNKCSSLSKGWVLNCKIWTEFQIWMFLQYFSRGWLRMIFYWVSVRKKKVCYIFNWRKDEPYGPLGRPWKYVSAIALGVWWQWRPSSMAVLIVRC